MKHVWNTNKTKPDFRQQQLKTKEEIWKKVFQTNQTKESQPPTKTKLNNNTRTPTTIATTTQ